MKILYFGTYEKNYPRNKIFIEGLKKNDVKVIEINVPIKKRKKYSKNFIIENLSLIIDYFSAYLKLIIKSVKIKNYDLILVGFPSFPDVFLAKIISFFSRKKLVINPLVSIYNTLIEDRKVIKENSITAKIVFYLEKFGLKLSNKIILDTESHINYFTNKFGLNKNKFIKVFVGADETIFYPKKPKENKKFKVGFYGTFIPLHGIKYIIKAVKILEKENIEFEIIGKGQLYVEISNLAKQNNISNIKFFKPVKLEELPGKIARFDVCLGIFGKTEKASNVIPNKVFQCIAMKKPVITRESKAVKEVFSHKENIFFCRMNGEKSLANTIIELKKNKVLRERIALNGYNLFKEKFIIEKIGKELKERLNEIN